jgi:eukaryotic-like serine/threonine-protein kinase
MTWRTRIRGWMPWAIAVIGGFLAAYLFVAFVVFPSGVIPRDVRVPSVTGLSFDDATRRLAERGLRGVRGEERSHAASPPGTVLEQVPSAGSRDVEGAAVSLTVSAGPRNARVPSLVGLARERAESQLEAAGFDVGQVTERDSDRPRGEVLEVQPAPGTQVQMPGTVALVVSAGPPPPPPFP